jgi:hypothetical protein
MYIACRRELHVLHTSASYVHMIAADVHIIAIHVHITPIHVNVVHLACTLCTSFRLRCTPAHPTDIVYIILTEVACLHVLQTLCTIYLHNLHLD